ncbi:2-succinyl-5-enolpyruvyl-6-hydroxy-3-cyclohexene-1-carboxylate synthase [Pseudonocardia sediminis]|uniref:2-succinyl-5-enolpyruvyl-6-hydroxy-3-cyclohexene-1-carboxylate synthase n=1 Tax=Pseudonocardia sediminis TaxID=1397368 RepID=A0A4Q7V1V5_PSEST|nr:2-succinyl-5-enolpyruvyl-6-hydroxy-3-cyclohexene-1-carboxylic-acid synthase [Pseudonocardia sediminis]RZT88507.1 2-succinyl-5-enolpyruvyl-6-hydroxy-3-cyclohexene-1-carboxylate synthase [Pseudonocardia sediminis]
MNPSTTQARVIVDELARCGVAEAVLCPGSRNAPMAFALRDADTAGRIRLHVRTDERTAGFLALGLSLSSGRPVPVVVTSGTAVANLHPAVLEASHAGVALLALTSDRPPELLGTGASQTIDQSRIFGAAVRWTGATAVATDDPRAPARWRSTVARAVAAATGAPGTPPGPVQLNLPFLEPLVPDGDAGRAGDLGGRPDGLPWTEVSPVHRAAPPLPLDPSAPTLVVAGSGGPDVDPALLAGAPVVAEPSSPLWCHATRTAPWLLGRPELRPEQVLVVGRPTLHRGVSALLADPGVAVYAVAGAHGEPWTDVAGAVRAVGSVPPLRPPPEFRDAWHAADGAASAALDAALSSGEGDGAPGLRLARDLVAAQPGGAQLVIGSSNPVRDVALAAAPRAGLTMRANRGVAGIDGTVSTAVGAALAHDGPTVALLGDLTLLHDTTGLYLGPYEPRPDLTLVVLNDDGGGIFHLLEQGSEQHARSFERVFGTPTGVDLQALASAAGIGYARFTGDPADLVAQRGAGVRIVEVRARRDGLRDTHAALRGIVERAADRAVERVRTG